MLAIIIVSYNTRDLLHCCINSVHASLTDSGISYEIIVVDNASSDGTPAMLRADHPQVCLLEPGRNLGFAGGNNLALRRVLGIGCQVLETTSPIPNTQYPIPKYVLLLNPDTEVQGDTIPRLVRYGNAHPDVAVVGPQLRYADGSPQPSRRRFPTRATFFFESTPLANYWPDNPWARRYRYAETPDDIEQRVDWLVGAALLVRREAIERAGLLDASFRMYSEELEWQERIQDFGFWILDFGLRRNQSKIQNPKSKIVYLPDAVIIHHEGKSSEQALARRYIDFQCSRLRHARMRYGTRFAMLLRWFLIVSYAAQLCIEAAKWLLGHKRPLRAARVQVYRQVVRALRSANYANDHT